MNFLRYFLVILFFTLTACSTTTSNNETSSNKAEKKEYVIVLNQNIQMKTKGEFGNGNINPGDLYLQKGTYPALTHKRKILESLRYGNSKLPAKFHHKKTFRKKTVSSVYPALDINKKNELRVYLRSNNGFLYVGKIIDSSKFELVEVTKKDAS